MQKKIIVTDLAELRAGDRIVAFDAHKYKAPLIVTDELAPIEAGSPVIGVRVAPPKPDDPIEWVLYPNEYNGHELAVERGDAR